MELSLFLPSQVADFDNNLKQGIRPSTFFKKNVAARVIILPLRNKYFLRMYKDNSSFGVDHA